MNDNETIPIRDADDFRALLGGVPIRADNGDLSNEPGKAEEAGRKMLIPKRQISEEHGYMAVFENSEGNRVMVHSRT